MNETNLIRSYRGLTRLAAPVLPLWVKRRALRGKEDPTRQGERFGETSRLRPDGKLIWMHGASVGECTLLLPVIEKLHRHYPQAHVLLTSGTLTSADLMAQRLPHYARHQYVPLDTPTAVTRFLNHWRPDMGIWAESEIWPNLIQGTHARGIPMALINARLSAKSVEGWSKRKASAQALFGCFDTILAANAETANGLTWVLGHEVEMAGNLKDAAPALPIDNAAQATLKKQIKNRPVWCAASTHSGEDPLILTAHHTVLKDHKNALLILAPRHPERRDRIITDIDAAGLRYAVRSKGDRVTARTQVLLFDTLGEMGLAYSLSDIAFVCGSLINGLSGHNPLEPARLNCAVLTGAHISSFADTYMSMFAFQAAERILNPDMIGSRISDLFSHPDTHTTLMHQGRSFASSRDDVLAFVWDKLAPLFKKAMA